MAWEIGAQAAKFIFLAQAPYVLQLCLPVFSFRAHDVMLETKSDLWVSEMPFFSRHVFGDYLPFNNTG